MRSEIHSQPLSIAVVVFQQVDLTRGFLANLVMPGLVPGIHAFGVAAGKTWMAGPSPAMTRKRVAFKS
jgi:hypothetical protein